jgi:mannose-6-phosphate isomerase-like protein (cupin superfamily)
MALHIQSSSVPPYITKDGSAIRELMHPAVHGNNGASLAEATLPAGAQTLLHRHRVSEELYHVSRGQGRMRLGDERFDIAVGDTVCIAPGTPHCIENTGTDPLVILCVCSPAYAHEDTELI